MPSGTKPHPAGAPAAPRPGTVGGPPASAYTGAVSSAPTTVSIPWWREAGRSWAPVLGLAALLVFQMVSLQRQIGELRTDLHREIGGLRAEMQQEMGSLRAELRTELRAVKEGVTRLEVLIEQGAAPRPGG